MEDYNTIEDTLLANLIYETNENSDPNTKTDQNVALE